jgi:putative transposase
MILHLLLAMFAGWIQRHQQQVLTYLQAENRILKAQLGGRRLRLTDTERRRLAALAYPLGRRRLQEVATIATPDTLLRWYHRLIAQKFDGSHHRHHLGRPRVIEEIEQLVVRMAEENATWGYRRIQGALANLGHSIDAITVRNILRRHHLDPAPRRRQAGMSWEQFLKLHWEILAATDFFTMEMARLPGFVTDALRFAMDLATQYVQLAGISPQSQDALLVLCTRLVTAPSAGCLVGTRGVIHDLDIPRTRAFDHTRSPPSHEGHRQAGRHSGLRQSLTGSHHVWLHQDLDARRRTSQPGIASRGHHRAHRAHLCGILTSDDRDAA